MWLNENVITLHIEMGFPFYLYFRVRRKRRILYFQQKEMDGRSQINFLRNNVIKRGGGKINFIRGEN